MNQNDTYNIEDRIFLLSPSLRLAPLTEFRTTVASRFTLMLSNTRRDEGLVSMPQARMQNVISVDNYQIVIIDAKEPNLSL